MKINNAQIGESSKEHENFHRVRAFIWMIVKYESPICEAEIEEIARCALAGGYKFNLDAFVQAIGLSVLRNTEPTLADIVFDC